MADTAFDPNLPPEYQLPQSPFPQGDATPPAPASPPAAPPPTTPAPTQAVTPNQPPTLGQQPTISPEDQQDINDHTTTLRDEVGSYSNNTIDWRTGKPVAAADLVDWRQDPRIAQMMDIKTRIDQLPD